MGQVPIDTKKSLDCQGVVAAAYETNFRAAKQQAEASRRIGLRHRPRDPHPMGSMTGPVFSQSSCMAASFGDETTARYRLMRPAEWFGFLGVDYGLVFD